MVAVSTAAATGWLTVTVAWIGDTTLGSDSALFANDSAPFGFVGSTFLGSKPPSNFERADESGFGSVVVTSGFELTSGWTISGLRD